MRDVGTVGAVGADASTPGARGHSSGLAAALRALLRAAAAGAEGQLHLRAADAWSRIWVLKEKGETHWGFPCGQMLAS